MKTLTSTQAKQSFGDMLQVIQSEPVKITKRNKDFAVLISSEQYDDLKSLEVYEDLIFGKLAKESLESGLHTEENTDKFFSRLHKKYLGE